MSTTSSSSSVFGAILAGLILVKVNVINLLLHVAYYGLFAAAAAEYSGRVLTGEGFVTKFAGPKKSNSATFRESVLPALSDSAEALEAWVYKVVFAQDIEATLKAGGISYVLSKLTSWFSLYSLIFTSVLLAFSGPYIYQSNKKEIDAAVAEYSKLAKDKTSEYTALAQDKIAPQLEALAKKTGPVGSFIQSKLPTRTAGTTVGSHAYSSTYTPHSGAAAEPSVGVTTGATKFPEVPSHVSPTAPKSVTEAVDATVEPSL
ncbi:hypothetical protein JCM33374_g3279 [Metschnikowia sp. JCM 33374]|nr:hypothetical protein JCM33374_g3279 [Metschnikowia sp. JCM 33374]